MIHDKEIMGRGYLKNTAPPKKREKGKFGEANEKKVYFPPTPPTPLTNTESRNSRTAIIKLGKTSSVSQKDVDTVEIK